jgi:tetratricopeptide (TPR) repeat protein
MRLSNFEAALKCFKKAQEMSPNNIERICLIAETETELGNEEQAKAALQTAKAIDPDAQAVTEAQVKVAITKGDSLSAKNLMESFDSVENIVSYMNNKAVAFAKIGKPNEAIGLYKKTLESIPDHLPDPKAIVLYNLALAQIKDKEYDAAMGKLNEAAKFTTSRIAKKIASLRERLKSASEKGQTISLKATDATVAIKANAPASPGAGAGAAGESGLTSEEEQAKMLAMVEAKRGDMCCFMIFTSPEQQDARVPALQAKQPRFQSRSAIEREEAMNANLGKESA